MKTKLLKISNSEKYNYLNPKVVKHWHIDFEINKIFPYIGYYRVFADDVLLKTFSFNINDGNQFDSVKIDFAIKALKNAEEYLQKIFEDYL